jgi:putative hydrolase of the HAD superfamily
MTNSTKITALLVDIGGVLLTDGWSQEYRTAAAAAFGLDLQDLEQRHHQAFDTYELGRLSLEDYLEYVVFHQDRPFTRAQFRSFMLDRSRPFPPMLELVQGLKARYGLKIVVVSNEGRELNAHRIATFKLNAFVDAFVSSCFVHLRKPDPAIFRLALDIAQIPIEQVLYLENTPMFIQVAEGLGIRSLLHTDYASTVSRLAALGLRQDGPIP